MHRFFLITVGLMMTSACGGGDAEVRTRYMVRAGLTADDMAKPAERTTVTQSALTTEALPGEWRLKLATPDYDIDMPATFTRTARGLEVRTIHGSTQAYAVGPNVAFTIPIEIDDQLIQLDFAGRVDGGVIDHGIAEAQGDGATLRWTAERRS